MERRSPVLTDPTAFDARFEVLSRRPPLGRAVLGFVGVTVPLWLVAAGLAVVTVLILLPGLYLVPVGAGVALGGFSAWRYPGMTTGGLAAVASLGSLPQAFATAGVLSGLTTLDASFEGSALWTWIVLSFPLSAPVAGVVSVLLSNAGAKLLTGRG